MANRPDHLTIQQRLILDHLRQHRGMPCSMSRLVVVLYGDRPDGGPDNPEGTIRYQIHCIRKWLKARDVDLLTIGVNSGAIGYMLDPDAYDRLDAALQGLASMEIDLARARLAR